MANRAERRRILRNSTTGGLTMVTGGPQGQRCTGEAS